MSTALTEADTAKKEKKVSPFSDVNVGDTGIAVKNGAEMWSLAQSISRSGLAPKGIETPEAILIALQLGFELGLPPMASLQNIAVINGRPALWGDAVLAVVRATGELEQFTEWYEQGGKELPRNPVDYTDDTVAVCRVKRRGCEPSEVGFSVADAKRAGLWDKAGPWKQYPFRMLRSRARGYALRDAFGDALRGLLTDDEAANIPTVDARSVENVQPSKGTAGLRSKLGVPSEPEPEVEQEADDALEPSAAVAPDRDVSAEFSPAFVSFRDRMNRTTKASSLVNLAAEVDLSSDISDDEHGSLMDELRERISIAKADEAEAPA